MIGIRRDIASRKAKTDRVEQGRRKRRRRKGNAEAKERKKERQVAETS